MILDNQTPTPIFVGVVHLKPLLGAPRFAGSMSEVIDSAVADAVALQRGGVDAIIVENFGDQPFFRDRCPDIAMAAFVRAALEVRRAVDVPIGLNFLRNAGEQAIAAAAAIEAAFIRINVLVGARLTDQGIIEGRAAQVLRLRREFGPSIKIIADVAVKHSAPLGPRPLEEEATEALGRGGADAVIVSGTGTGMAAPLDDVRLLSTRDIGPIFIGSGLSANNAKDYLPFIDGAIVGTALKEGGQVEASVSADAVRQMRAALGR